MQRRDEITIQKIISEMEVGIDMLGNTSLEDVFVTVHDEYPMLIMSLRKILEENR